MAVPGHGKPWYERMGHHVPPCIGTEGRLPADETGVLCIDVERSRLVGPRFLRGTVRAGRSPFGLAGAPGKNGLGGVAARGAHYPVSGGVFDPVRALAATDRVAVVEAKVRRDNLRPAARGPGPVRLLRVGDASGNEHPHRPAAHLPRDRARFLVLARASSAVLDPPPHLRDR